MEIREAKVKDAKQIEKFKKETILILGPKFYSKDIVEHWAKINTIEGIEKSIQKGNRKMFVAEEKGNILGVASLDKTNKTMQTLYVDIKHQGKGIGKALCNKCEEELKKLGNKKIIIEGALTARDFYLHMRYKLVKEKEIDFFGMNMKVAILEKKF